MTIRADNGEKVTRFYKILITAANGEKTIVTHKSPRFQHTGKGERQNCIGYFDKPQNANKYE